MRQRISLIVLVFVLSFAAVGSAQPEQCTAVAQAAFAALNDGCATSGSNSACFVMAAEFDGSTDAPFAEVGDEVTLDNVSLLNTSPLDLELEQWGMARLNVHANVPISVSETGLTYILIGDTQIENAVPADVAFTPVNPIGVQTLVGSNLRSAPSTDAQVLLSAPVGAELMADGRTADNAWVHVTFEDTVAWVSSQIVVPTEGQISDLPVLSNDSRTLMQSFIYTNGIEPSECTDESPSMLLIQAPEGVSATITVNGADIRFTGTIALRMLPDNQLQLATLGEGSATAGVVVVPPGFVVSAPVNADGRTVEGGWSALRPMSSTERNFFLVLELMGDDGMYQTISVPTQEQISATLQSVNRANAGAGQTVAASASGGATCAGFQPTSPLDGLAFGSTTFYWDGAPGATEYRVNIFRDGELARSETIDAFSTTTTVDTSSGSIGDGLSYAWNVEALANGEVLCTSGSVQMLREASAQEAGSGGGGGNDDDGGGNDCSWCG